MFKRLLLYLKEMFPLTHIISSLLLGLTFFATISLADQKKIPFYTSEIYESLITVLLLSLMLRIMDEFKDLKDDLINFPERPIPSGKVLISDLKILQSVVIFLMIILNFDNILMMLGLLISLFYSYLMYKWFFIENKMRTNLPLALLSHHPVVYTYLFYLFLTYRSIHSTTSIQLMIYALPIGILLLIWELSRKIRNPNQETNYTTYSKIWGIKKCITIVAGLISFNCLFLIYYFLYFELNILILLLFFITLLLILKPLKQFYQSRFYHFNLKPMAEHFALTYQLIFIISYLLYET